MELVARRAIQPDLVVVDYNLPNDLNGLQVIAGLHNLLQHEIPSIILTGDISTDAFRDIARQGSTHLNQPGEGERTGAEIVQQQLLAAPNARRRMSGRSQAGRSEVPAAYRLESTIFVVDDDDGVRETMRELLEAEGRPVESYASGEEFLAAYHPGTDGCLPRFDAGMPGT